MLDTQTEIAWPSKLKIGARSKKGINLQFYLKLNFQDEIKKVVYTLLI